MLTNTPEDWNAMIENVDNTEAKEALRKKESIVKSYMKTNWGIDMVKFQKSVVAAIDAAAQ